MDGFLVLILGAEVQGRRVDVRVEAGHVESIAASLPPREGESSFDAGGGVLLPGLRDHHIHLMALAAALGSTRCGPPLVRTRAQLAEALGETTPTEGWIRGTGYFESVAGDLDRARLDALRSDVPIRIQHRSGVMWFLNSRALAALGIDSVPDAAAEIGIERDASGRATGRLFRADEWLRARLPSTDAPDLTRVGRLLASCGVTHATDCTPSNGRESAAMLRRAQAEGALPQTLAVMGGLELEDAAGGTPEKPLSIDAHKIMLDEPALPTLDDLVARIRDAHGAGRAVAFHTVTRAEILFAQVALEAAGPLQGDRLEHASIAPPEAIEAAARLGLTIVTQPNFVAERGDDYLERVEAKDLPHLYRVRSWLESDVGLGLGTDAPFGEADPWCAMRAAVERRTPSGRVLGGDESITPERALHLFTGPLRKHDPRPPEGPPVVREDDPADLCLLDRPWQEARLALSREHVVATFCRGKLVYERRSHAA